MSRWRLVVAGLIVVAHAAVAAAPPAGVRLVEVTAESTAASQSVLITASEPASYTTFQPDPSTVLITLRGVEAGGIVTRLRPAPDDPVQSVEVFEALDDDGIQITRVRIGLSEPTRYEVRSWRQTIQVRFARSVPSSPAPARTPAEAPPVSPPVAGTEPATVILSVETAIEPDAINVTLHGNGRLSPGRIYETEQLPPRLVVELPHLAAEAASLTSIEVDPVKQVRVVSDAGLTQVVLDLVRPTVYRIERPVEDDRILRLVFPREGAIDPVARIGPEVTRVDDGGVTSPRPADVPRRPVWEGREIARLDGPVSFAVGNVPLLIPVAGDVPPRVWPQIRQLPDAAVTLGSGISPLLMPVADDVPPRVWPQIRQLLGATVTLGPGSSSLLIPVADDVPPRVWPQIRQLLGATVTLGPGSSSLLIPVADDVPPRVWPQIRQLPGTTVTLGPGTLPLLIPVANDVPPRVWPQIQRLAGTTVALDVASAGLRYPEPLDLVLQAPGLDEAALSTPSPAAAATVPTDPPAAVVAAAVPTDSSDAAVAAEFAAIAVPPAVVAEVAPLPDPVSEPSQIPNVASSEATEFLPLRGSSRTRGTAPLRSGRLVGQRVVGGQEYTGDLISMNFQGTDLRAVLRVFAEVSGLNLVIDPSVQGEVNVALTQVPWDQAFAIILRANGLDYEVDGTVVRIASVQRLQEEAQAQTLLAQREAEAGELVLLTRQLSYARAEDLVQLLTQTVLSPRGEVFTDARTNQLIIRDLEDRLIAVSTLLDTLDRAELQVEIEARIVEVTQESARALGIQWGVTGRASQDIGNTLPFSFPNRGSLTGRSGGPDGQGPSGLDPRALPDENAATVVNMGVNAATSAIGLTLGAVNGALNLDIALSALESQGQARVLSSPHIVTQNNVQAEIVQGDQIPFQTVANNTVTTQFVDAALVLRVTPQITADQVVIMQVEVTNDFPDFSKVVDNGPPAIKTQRVATTIKVADGATAVIGGIFKNTEQQTNTSTPLLEKIPFLGWMFRSSNNQERIEELLIFLSPRILP